MALYTNHSGHNNLSVKYDISISEESFFIANRDIQEGEELTNNYYEFDEAIKIKKPDFLVDNELLCPVCNQTQVEYGDLSICEVCGWENDPSQLKYPDMKGGANLLSLDETRENFHKQR